MSHVDVGAITITPGICAVTEQLPWETLRTKWEKLREKVFDREQNPIYERAMLVCAIVRCSKTSLFTGKKMFKDLLTDHHGMEFNDYSLVPDAILYRYWELSKSPKFWRGTIQVGCNIAYQQAMDLWQLEHRDDIEYCRGDLETCLNG